MLKSNLPEIYKLHDNVFLKNQISFHENMAIVFSRCREDLNLTARGLDAMLQSISIHKRIELKNNDIGSFTKMFPDVAIDRRKVLT